MAADLPSFKAAPFVPPPPPLWTGLYFGANVGGIFDASNGATTSAAPLFNDLTDGAGINGGAATFFGSASAGSIAARASLSNLGVIGGGQIGFNWQFNNILAGIEADIQGATLSSVASAAGAALEPATASLVASTSSYTKTLNYLGTVRGRLGFLFTPTLLVFGSGGLAYGGLGFTHGVFQSSANPNFPLTASSAVFSDANIGWTAGGGVEWMFLPNWSAKAEYLYYDLGTATAAGVATGVAPNGNLLFGSSYQSSTHFNGHIVRAGVNYHFHWFAPATVAAKY